MRLKLHSVALQQCRPLFKSANAKRISFAFEHHLNFMECLYAGCDCKQKHYMHFNVLLSDCLPQWELVWDFDFMLFSVLVNGPTTTRATKRQNENIFMFSCPSNGLPVKRVITSNNKNALSQISSSTTSSHFSLQFVKSRQKKRVE